MMMIGTHHEEKVMTIRKTTCKETFSRNDAWSLSALCHVHGHGHCHCHALVTGTQIRLDPALLLIGLRVLLDGDYQSGRLNDLLEIRASVRSSYEFCMHTSSTSKSKVLGHNLY